MPIEEFLKNNAVRFADKAAVVCGDQQVTYQQLYADCVACAERHAEEGREPGKLVPLRATPTIDYLIEYFAIHVGGCIAVPLAKDLSDEEFAHYAAELQNVEVPEDTADILFTTGTTGKSKGVMISHDTIMADAENLIDAHKYSSDLTFVIAGPLNHCGCWSKVFPCIIQGATIILKDGIKNLDDLFLTLESASTKVATFMVPSSIKIAMEFGAERLERLSDKIDFIETGGAPMAPKDLQKLCQLLPHSRLYNTYASTESGIVATYNFNEGECLHGCVGPAMKNSAISISPEGYILCSGRTLMTGYFKDPQTTEEILKNGVITMSDFGKLDEQGRLWLIGRNGDTINTGAYKVEPTEVENAAMEHPAIKDCICIATPHIVLGTALKLLYVPSDQTTVTKREIALFLKSKLEVHKVPLAYEQVESINMTFNGKKDRKSYRS